MVAYCRSCHVCQLVGEQNQKIPVAPLCPSPVCEEPFCHVLIDGVGPYPRTKKGHGYLFTITDVTTRFPEVIPLRDIKAHSITLLPLYMKRLV